MHSSRPYRSSRSSVLAPIELLNVVHVTAGAPQQRFGQPVVAERALASDQLLKKPCQAGRVPAVDHPGRCRVDLRRTAALGGDDRYPVAYELDRSLREVVLPQAGDDPDMHRRQQPLKVLRTVAIEPVNAGHPRTQPAQPALVLGGAASEETHVDLRGGLLRESLQGIKQIEEALMAAGVPEVGNAQTAGP